MSLEGKTIARVDDCGDTLYFTDGTALRITSDDGHYTGELDWAAVQQLNHQAQGRREKDRMNRLERTLHPRDRQWLAHQRRELQERCDREWEKTATPEMIGMRNMERWMIQDIQRSMNRTTFGGLFDELPPLRKKHRPFKPAPSGSISFPIRCKKVRRS